MGPTFEEEAAWDPLETVTPPSDGYFGDRRHSSSASSSTLSAGGSNATSSTGGRRSRPSVASASSQLPTVQEKRERKEQRALSKETIPSLLAPTLTPLDSEETVVSSQKVEI